MGVLVLLPLLAAIPACGIAAVYWARVAGTPSNHVKVKCIAKAARWTALALFLQGVSLLATVLLATIS